MVTEPHSSQSVLESLSSCFGFDPRHWLVPSSPTVPVDTAEPARHQISHTVRDLVTSWSVWQLENQIFPSGVDGAQNRAKRE